MRVLLFSQHSGKLLLPQWKQGNYQGNCHPWSALHSKIPLHRLHEFPIFFTHFSKAFFIDAVSANASDFTVMLWVGVSAVIAVISYSNVNGAYSVYDVYSISAFNDCAYFDVISDFVVFWLFFVCCLVLFPAFID